ncbi:hypothetical protein [Oleiagrimonas sp. MCCC 1A03011]|nr:hypothetical protein [Oleiagrimonas sp. MCCC 1A03011]RAP57622.1 hypothetical protein BTJ49_06845 [Oleiagrimonas sp. MCCC 1A03011]
MHMRTMLLTGFMAAAALALPGRTLHAAPPSSCGEQLNLCLTAGYSPSYCEFQYDQCVNSTQRSAAQTEHALPFKD